MDRRKSFNDLSPLARGLVVAAGAVQVGLAVTAGIDLARRPADQVRGPKPAWAAALFVNFVGPLAYFVFGRRR